MKRITMALPCVFLLLLLMPQASADTIKEGGPFITSVVTCSGERIDLSGDILILSHTSVSTDGTHHNFFSAIFRNVIGQDSTGVTYREVGRTGFTIEVNQGGTVATTGETPLILVSESGDANLHLIVTNHFTVDANGVFTVTFVKIHSVCVG